MSGIDNHEHFGWAAQYLKQKYGVVGAWVYDRKAEFVEARFTGKEFSLVAQLPEECDLDGDALLRSTGEESVHISRVGRERSGIDDYAVDVILTRDAEAELVSLRQSNDREFECVSRLFGEYKKVEA